MNFLEELFDKINFLFFLFQFNHHHLFQATLYKNIRNATSSKLIFEDLKTRRIEDLQMKEQNPSKKTLFDHFQQIAKKHQMKKEVNEQNVIDPY